MAQFNGKFKANGSYNVNSTGPFDARLVVDYKSDLDSNATFSYNAYEGMIVSVQNDGENNGAYIIKAINDDDTLIYERLVEGEVFNDDIATKGWYRIAETADALENYGATLHINAKRVTPPFPDDNYDEIASTLTAVISGTYTEVPKIVVVASSQTRWGYPIEKVRIVYPKTKGFHKGLKAYLDIKINRVKDGQPIRLKITSVLRDSWDFYSSAELIDENNANGIEGLPTIEYDGEKSTWDVVSKKPSEDISEDISAAVTKLENSLEETKEDLTNYAKTNTANITANTANIQKNTESINRLTAQLDYLSLLSATVESSYDKRTTADGEPIVGKSKTTVLKIYGDTGVIDNSIISPSISGIKSTTYNMVESLDNMVNSNFVKNDDGSYTLTKSGSINSSRQSATTTCHLQAGIEYAISLKYIDNITRFVVRFLNYKNDTILYTKVLEQGTRFTLSADATKMLIYIPSEPPVGAYATFKDFQITTVDKKDLPYTLPYQESVLSLPEKLSLGGFISDYAGASVDSETGNSLILSENVDAREYICIKNNEIVKYSPSWDSTVLSEMRLVSPTIVSSTEDSVTIDVPGVYHDKFEDYTYCYRTFNLIKFKNMPSNVIWEPAVEFEQHLGEQDEGEYACGSKFILHNTTKEEIENSGLIVLILPTEGYDIGHAKSQITAIDNDLEYIAYRNGEEEILGNDYAKHGIYPTIQQEYLTYAIGGIN